MVQILAQRFEIGLMVREVFLGTKVICTHTQKLSAGLIVVAVVGSIEENIADMEISIYDKMSQLRVYSQTNAKVCIVIRHWLFEHTAEGTVEQMVQGLRHQ